VKLGAKASGGDARVRRREEKRRHKERGFKQHGAQATMNKNWRVNNSKRGNGSLEGVRMLKASVVDTVGQLAAAVGSCEKKIWPSTREGPSRGGCN
jgi:hypothetical protein